MQSWSARHVRRGLRQRIESDRCSVFDRGFISYGLMIVGVLILLSTGEQPNRAMHTMVWYSRIDLASRKELEAFIKKRIQPALA
jgi:hypothetical protein